MNRDIETYLKQLQGALAAGGADPALVQDALFDAEEHLQSELAAGGHFTAVAQAYGSPEEVAAAYLGLTVSAPTVESATGAAAPGETYLAPEVTGGPYEFGGPAGVPPAGNETAEPPTVYCTTCGSKGQSGQVYCRDCGSQLPSAGQVGAAAGGAGVGDSSGRYGPQPAVAGGAYGRQEAAPQSQYPIGVQSGMAAAGGGRTQAGPKSVWMDIFGPFADPKVWTSLVYMILSLGLGIAYFTLVVTGMATGVGMLPAMLSGVLVLFLTLAVVRGVSLFEGRLVEVLLGTRMPRRLRSVPPVEGFWRRVWSTLVFWVRDSRTWLTMVYMLLMLPLGIIYFTVAVTLFATSLGLITSPIWAWFSNWTFIYQGITYHGSFPYWGVPVAFVVGVLLLIGSVHAIKWIGGGHAMFAKAMLVRLG